jgi:hypothetical protein
VKGRSSGSGQLPSSSTVSLLNHEDMVRGWPRTAEAARRSPQGSRN